jgi:hypothetical protein
MRAIRAKNLVILDALGAIACRALRLFKDSFGWVKRRLCSLEVGMHSNFARPCWVLHGEDIWIFRFWT